MTSSNDKNQEDIEFELHQKMKQKSDGELYEVILKGNCDEKYAAALCLTTQHGTEKTFIRAAEFCKSYQISIENI